MKKLLLLGLPLVAVFLGLPILALAVITTSTTAATDCHRQQSVSTATDPSQLGDLGDLGVIDGPVGGPVTGQIGVAAANIPNRSRLSGFRASMPKVLSTRPDFVALNEVSDRSLGQIEATTPGYRAYRNPQMPPGLNRSQAKQAMSDVVLWRHDTWTRRNAGRVQIVDDDNAYHQGRPVTGANFATWALLERPSDGAVVSSISVHHMTNRKKFPRQHGNPPLTRAQQYGQGMDIVVKLANSLATHGPVLIAGDMNTHRSQANLNWSAAAKMKAAGYGWYNHAVDFGFFPQYLGVKLMRGWTGRMVSGHRWVAARLAMNGAGPTQAPDPATVPESDTTEAIPVADTVPAAAPASDVHAQLMRLQFAEGYPTLTADQAGNALAIAQVARYLGVPRRGLEIAIAVAIQESKLVNLAGGDRDSGGLFQQRPSQGWGDREQVTNPQLATEAFFGRAQHTNNPGLLDIPNWEQMPLTRAAQSVQNSGYPDAYARWEPVAKEIAALLGGDLPDAGSVVPASTEDCTPEGDVVDPVTLGTLNLLGAGHTDGKTGGGNEHTGFAGWQARLPKAIAALGAKNVTIAGLQELHGPQEKALASRYGAQWGMYPENGGQNKVIWDRNSWQLADARLVDIPYFGGRDVGMPLVQLRSTSTGQSIWVWSIHNPANTRGNARRHRVEALRRELDTLTDLKATGEPVVILGDFNDAFDGEQASHCLLTPAMTNAFGGAATPCRIPRKDAPIDHIYGANLTWASASVEVSTRASIRAKKIGDHPLVVATTAGSSLGCTVENSRYNLGPVKPQLTRLVNVLGPMFDIKTVGGYRESATDPNGHPAGLAADFMVPLTPAGKAQGAALVAYAQAHATEFGIDYIIWRQRIWSPARADEGWRPMADRGSPTANHTNHPHLSLLPSSDIVPTTGPNGAAAGSSCGEVVYPVPTRYVGNDADNWHDTGPYWSK
jgi:endonuclease/exonuclease/phosphatase (EEP) superfamily protein YafD